MKVVSRGDLLSSDDGSTPGIRKHSGSIGKKGNQVPKKSNTCYSPQTDLGAWIDFEKCVPDFFRFGSNEMWFSTGFGFQTWQQMWWAVHKLEVQKSDWEDKGEKMQV